MLFTDNVQTFRLEEITKPWNFWYSPTDLSQRAERFRPLMKLRCQNSGNETNMESLKNGEIFGTLLHVASRKIYSSRSAYILNHWLTL